MLSIGHECFGQSIEISESTRDLGQEYAVTVAGSDLEVVPYHIQKGVTDRTFSTLTQDMVRRRA